MNQQGPTTVTSNGIDPHAADAIYDLLVEQGGAHPSYRQQFIHAVGYKSSLEFRFQGKFGFGGKFWTKDWHVNGYPEDMTLELRALESQINMKLASMRVNLGYGGIPQVPASGRAQEPSGGESAPAEMAERLLSLNYGAITSLQYQTGVLLDARATDGERRSAAKEIQSLIGADSLRGAEEKQS